MDPDGENNGSTTSISDSVWDTGSLDISTRRIATRVAAWLVSILRVNLGKDKSGNVADAYGECNGHTGLRNIHQMHNI